jgi:hypothetical protein
MCSTSYVPPGYTSRHQKKDEDADTIIGNDDNVPRSSLSKKKDDRPTVQEKEHAPTRPEV